MTPQTALIELLERVTAQHGTVLVNERELSKWPPTAVAAMKSQKLLVKVRPASSAVCPGCERECVMPVYTAPNTTHNPRPFIVCDKRSDVNRVAVPPAQLEQWHTTFHMIADVLTGLLVSSTPASTAAENNRWHIGVLKGKKNKSPITLIVDDDLKLLLAGHTVQLIEVLSIENDSLALNKKELIRLVDKPSGNTEVELPDQRRDRLRARVCELKASGTKAFLQVVAEEEGISVSRLKQLTKVTPVPADIWSGLGTPQKKGASLKQRKAKA